MNSIYECKCKTNEYSRKNMIRKIHQVWVQGEEHFKKTQPIFYSYSTLWKELFSNYEYKLWVEEDYLPLIQQYSYKLLDVYNTPQLPYAGKSDIARYVILYYIGGLYIDADVEPYKCFDFLIEGDNIDLVLVGMALCRSKYYLSSYRYGNTIIYSKEGCIYIKAMIDRIIENPYNKQKYGISKYIWSYSGPGGLTHIVDELQLYNKPNVRIIPHNMVEVCDFSNLGILLLSKEEVIRRYPFACSSHKLAGSWIFAINFWKKIGLIYSLYNEWNDFFILLALFIIFIQSYIIYQHC